MFIKLIWVTIMFLVTVWGIYIFSIGIDVPVAYYETSERIVVSDVVE